MIQQRYWIILFAVSLSIPLSAWASDPFAGVSPAPAAAEPDRDRQAFFYDNFGFRRELMAQYTVSDHQDPATRLSAGGELLKKFSTSQATVASLNVQFRVVWRNDFIPVQNDMEGMHREGWYLEYHNVYLDLYNVLNPVLSEAKRSEQIGRFNFRAGRFYVPFGLNLQTDTHGQILQLSNEENFGFERDWYTGLWGQVNDHVNYDLNYLTGSGYSPRFEGQTGLASGRLSLANRYSYLHGLEGGLSALGGERLDEEDHKINTWRSGADARFRHAVPTGLATATGEWSGGEDDHASVITQLYQGDYLHHSRRWGTAAQYRRFWRDRSGTEASVIGELTWYFRNDVANSNLHWIKLNIEKKVESNQSPREVTLALQYYRYW